MVMQPKWAALPASTLARNPFLVAGFVASNVFANRLKTSAWKPLAATKRQRKEVHKTPPNNRFDRSRRSQWLIVLSRLRGGPVNRSVRHLGNQKNEMTRSHKQAADHGPRALPWCRRAAAFARREAYDTGEQPPAGGANAAGLRPRGCQSGASDLRAAMAESCACGAV